MAFMNLSDTATMLLNDTLEYGALFAVRYVKTYGIISIRKLLHIETLLITGISVTKSS